jgi:Leucine-rich repeat (LRR) protein
VFKETIDLEMQYPELVELAEMILRKCNGLPLAIVTIGGFLANQPKNPLEWRKLNEHISAELERNPKLETIRNVLMRSYDGLPYHLKSCFLYMPIFPEDYRVGRARLVRRWTAEGYSREVRGMSMEEIANDYFMELISRSIILPAQVSLHSTKGIKSCQLHDLIREIGISKSMEENLVFTLEEGCISNCQATMRHLAINGNWKGDQSEFESTVDMSRVRSLTVFGKWKSFFISDKMRLLRVLDLEDTTDLRDHHLKHIGKILHLRYLSLRGCNYICHLPDSLGNLRELLTLDVRGTTIIKLPKSIINLQKLYNLRTGAKPDDEYISHPLHGEEGVMGYRACVVPLSLIISCLLWCAPQLIIDTVWDIDWDSDNGVSRRDVCTRMCCLEIPAIAMLLDKHGVLVPRGIRKLKALRTLGTVNIARRGKAIMQDIRRLTQLRKLGVTGVNEKNGHELCSAIVGLSRLESLFIRSEGEPGLSGCLDGEFSFPKSLQRLKLYGNLVKLPKWIQGLKNLVKLKLRSCRITDHDDAIQILGNLPNLASLHLLDKSFQGAEVDLSFCSETFQSLVVLELASRNGVGSVKFEERATPKLELLSVYLRRVNSSSLLGLQNLTGLKEVVLPGGSSEKMEYVRGELAMLPNPPVVRRVNFSWTM